MVSEFNSYFDSKIRLINFIIPFFCFYILWVFTFNPAIILGYIFLLTFFATATKGIKLKKSFFSIDVVIIFILLMVFYGILIGFLNGNKINYIVRNSGGVSCFLIYFFFRNRSKLQLNTLLYCLFTANLIYLLMMGIYVTGKIFGVYFIQMKFLLGDVAGSHLEGVYRSYTAGIFCCVPFIMTALFRPQSLVIQRVCFTKNLALIRSIGVISLLIFFVATFSKGTALIMLTILIIIVINSVLRLKLINLCILLLLIMWTIFLFESNPYIDLFYGIFLESTSGNSQRFEQHALMLEEYNITGSGTGATFKHFTRSHDAPYGSELSFHNVVHKYGIFSLAFMPLAMVAGHHLIKVVLSKYDETSLQILGAFAYFLPAIGNPILFQPALVVNLCFFLARLTK